MCCLQWRLHRLIRTEVVQGLVGVALCLQQTPLSAACCSVPECQHYLLGTQQHTRLTQRGKRTASLQRDVSSCGALL